MYLAQSPKNILLTGAGFTHNFGGYLGADLWSETFSHPSVQSHPGLRERFIKDVGFNFEDLYADVLADTVQHTCLRGALLEVFERLDAIARIALSAEQDHGIELAQLTNWVRLFSGTDAKRPGFIFTLNQDLFLERWTAFDLDPVLPGLGGEVQSREVSHTTKLTPRPIDPHADKARVIRGLAAVNVVKLHGSSNWQTSDGTLFVVGRDKRRVIGRWELLDAYFQIFREVLFRKDIRLWVIGYGFRDEHINELLREAIDKFGLRLHVIDPDSVDRLQQKMLRANIWHGLGAHHRQSLRRLFPRSGRSVEAEALRRMLQQYA